MCPGHVTETNRPISRPGLACCVPTPPVCNLPAAAAFYTISNSQKWSGQEFVHPSSVLLLLCTCAKISPGVCERREKGKKIPKKFCSRKAVWKSMPDAIQGRSHFPSGKEGEKRESQLLSVAMSKNQKKRFCGPLVNELEVSTSDWVYSSCRTAHSFQLEENGLRSILIRVLNGG